MAPITSLDIPIGPKWGYQIKWDGVRSLVRLDGSGGVEIFSKRVEPKNDRFPEIVDLLSPLRIGACVLDGEIAYFDGSRPNFQRVLVGVNRKKYDDSLIFVAFDMLYDNGEVFELYSSRNGMPGWRLNFRISFREFLLPICFMMDKHYGIG